MTTESKPDEILSAPTETEMNDRRAAACIFELRDAIDRLTERCAAYKGQIEAGAKRIEMAEAENARLAKELARSNEALVVEGAMACTECGALFREKDLRDAMIAQLRAALSESRAEGWRQGIEVAARVADGFTCGGCGMDGKSSAAIRNLPLPVSGGVEGEKLDE